MSAERGPRRLAEAQAALVAALVADGPVPPGFDDGQVAATRRALLRKRAGEAATHWPLLAAGLGERWLPTFAEHRGGHEPVGALRDGWDLARTLRGRGELPDGAAVELDEREAAHAYDGHSAPRPALLRRVRRWRHALAHTAFGRMHP